MNELRLATLAHDDWCLRDGEAVHREHPETFWLPPGTERRTLKRGMQAKLMFEMQSVDTTGEVESGVERMWVAVTDIDGGRYRGLLRNQPLFFDPDIEAHYLRWGAEVTFGPEHVIDILLDDPVPEKELEAFTRRWV